MSVSSPTSAMPTPTDDFTLTDVLEKARDAQGRSMLNGYLKGPLIGNGQHGKVYLAYNVKEDNKQVAIKAIKRNNPRADKFKKLRARGQQQQLPSTSGANHLPLTDKLGSTENKIRKEIAIMKKCRHINIVRLHEVIDDRVYAKIYMVMEYMAGGEIKWRNKDNEPILLVEQTQRIIRDVVLGLEYLHFNGIIHRDIKPANLLWTADRRTVKIADFGVSHFSYAQALGAHNRSRRKIGRAEDVDPSLMIDPRDTILLDESDLSKTAGTPPFMAPEVVADMTTDPTFGASAAGSAPGSPPGHSRSASVSSQQAGGTLLGVPGTRRPVTKAIDVWALGITLYALLFGTPPFFVRGQTEFVLYRMICNDDWHPLPTMGLDKIPSGARHPERMPLQTKRGKPVYREPGDLIMNLLDRLLEKKVSKRITLDEVKRHPWITEGISDVNEWLAATAPAKHARIFVTDEDTSGAMSNVRFRWSERISAVLRRTLKPVSSVHAITHRVGHALAPRPPTEPTSPTAAGKPSQPQSRKGKHRAVAPVRIPTAPILHTPRPRSSDRASLGSTSTTTTRRHVPSSRRGSETQTTRSIGTTSGGSAGEPSAAPPSVSTSYPDKQKHRFSLASLLPSGLRSKPSSPPPTQPPSSTTSAGTSAAASVLNSPTSGSPPAASTRIRGPGSKKLPISMSAASFNVASGTSNLHTRYSVEALAHHSGGRRPALNGAASYGVGGGQLAAEMRASSWGEPADYDHRGGYTRPVDIMSVHSGDALDEDAMLIGAGGVAAEVPPYLGSTPGTSPVLTSRMHVPSGHVVPPPPLPEDPGASEPASAVPYALLQHVEGEIPSNAGPQLPLHSRGPPTGAARPQATSPLGVNYYETGDWSSSDEEDGSDSDLPYDEQDSFAVDDDDFDNEDEDEDEPDQDHRSISTAPVMTPPPRIASGGGMYDDSSDSEEAAPVEIKRRRPSFAPGSSPPSRSFLSAGSG